MKASELNPIEHRGMVLTHHSYGRESQHIIQHVEQRSHTATIVWDEQHPKRAAVLNPDDAVTVARLT